MATAAAFSILSSVAALPVAPDCKSIPPHVRHQLASLANPRPAQLRRSLPVLKLSSSRPGARGLHVVASSDGGSVPEAASSASAAASLVVEPDSASKLEEAYLSTGTSDEAAAQETKAILSDVAHRWKELHGENNWKGILDPLDRSLRSEIIKYGEFAQATYDSFDYDEHSKYCGSCRFSRHNFIEKVGLSHHAGYEVTKYLYAMAHSHLPTVFKRSGSSNSWSKASNWMGYVSVVTDKNEIAKLGRRDIVISWRGTVTSLEWLEDVDGLLRPPNLCTTESSGIPSSKLEEIKVERGFLHLYTTSSATSRYNKKSAGEMLRAEVKRLVDLYKDDEGEIGITITGHSLGGALAILSAFDIASNKLNERGNGRPKIPISVFTFGGPRVGNASFKHASEDLGIKCLRIVNKNDKVPLVPGMGLTDIFEKMHHLAGKPFFEHLPWGYAHLGEELLVDNSLSPYLRNDGGIPDFHNLEAYLHLVDGFHGLKAAFESVTGRDHALVNKSSNFLKTDLWVPRQWWQVENKGLMRDQATGRWIQPERAPADIPSPETF